MTSEKTADLRDSLNQIEDSYKSSIKSIEKTATAEKAELDIIEKLIPRYEELNKKSNKTATEKAELKNIVDQINDVLPDTIKLVNEEKTAYDATTESIRNTIEARKESIESIAKQNAAIKAQESLLELKSANDNMTLEYAQGRIESLREWQDGLKFNLFDFGATIDWIDNKVFKTGDVEDQIKDLENYIKQYKQYQSIIDSYSSLGSVGSDGECQEKRPIYHRHPENHQQRKPLKITSLGARRWIISLRWIKYPQNDIMRPLKGTTEIIWPDMRIT